MPTKRRALDEAVVDGRSTLFGGLFDLLPEVAVILEGPGGEIAESNARFQAEVCRGGKFEEQQLLKFSDLLNADAVEAVLVTLRLLAGGAVGCSLVLGTLRTLTLKGGEEGAEFPVFRSYEWCGSKMDDGRLLLTGRRASGVMGNSGGCSPVAVAMDDQVVHFESELIDFFQNAPIALHWLSASGVVVWANKKELDTLGYEAHEYIGHNIMEFCPDEDVRVLETFRLLGSDALIKNVPFKFRTKTGDPRFFIIDSNVSYHRDGSFKHTRCFIRDDTDRQIKEALTKLDERRAKEAQQAKDAFVRRVFHELRTPLHVLTGLLGDGCDPSEALPPLGRDDLLECGRQVRCCNALMDAFSLASHFDRGQFLALSPAPVHLPALVAAVVERVQQSTSRDDVVWSVTFGPDASASFLVDTDELLLSQLLLALVSNACTYCAPFGRVEVAVCASGGGSPGEVGRAKGRYAFSVRNDVCAPIDAAVVHGYFQRLFHKAGASLSTPNSRRGSISAAGVGSGGGSSCTSPPSEEAAPAKPSSPDRARGLLRHQLTSREGLGLGLFVAFHAAQNLMSMLEFSPEAHPSPVGPPSHGALFTFCLDAPVLSYEETTAAAAAAAVVTASVEAASAAAATAYSLPPLSRRGQNIGMDGPRVSLPGSSGMAAVRLLRQQSAGAAHSGAPLPLQLSLWVAADECEAAAMHIERESPAMWPNPAVQAPEQSLSPRAPMDQDGGCGACSASSGQNVAQSNEVAVRALSGAVKSVLIVDDSPVCLKSMVRILERGGYRCQCATDGQQAVALLSCQPQIFSLCLMDLRMPIMDGLTAMQRARELRLSVPFIVLSADGADREVSLCALEAGAAACLGKPSSAKAVLTLVEQHVL